MISGNTIISRLWGYTSSGWRKLKTDLVSLCVCVVDFFHSEIHSGNFYFIKGWQDITGAGTNLDFKFVIPAGSKIPHSQWNIAGEAEFTLSLYEGVTTTTAGTSVTPVNANRNSLNTSIIEAYTAPVLTSGTLGDGGNGGTEIWSGKIGSGRDATVGRNSNYEVMGATDTEYWFRFTKSAAGTEWIDYDFNWYEHESNT